MNARRQSLALVKRVRAALEAHDHLIVKVQRLLMQPDDSMEQPAIDAVQAALRAIYEANDKLDIAISQTDEPTQIGFRKSRPPHDPESSR